MDKLEDFFEHEDAIVADAAHQVSILNDGLRNEDLSQEQYDELVNDILEVEHIQELADSIKRKVAIHKTFEIIKKIIGLIK